mgnify:CR=1 FL=1
MQKSGGDGQKGGGCLDTTQGIEGEVAPASAGTQQRLHLQHSPGTQPAAPPASLTVLSFSQQCLAMASIDSGLTAGGGQGGCW